jgi:hypothetical protein
MRNFRIPGSTAGVYAYRRLHEPEQRNARTVGFKNNFNSYVDESGNNNDALESIFSQLEDKVKPLLDRIMQTEKVNLNKYERADLAYFITTMHTRNEAFRRRTKAGYVAMTKMMQSITSQNKAVFMRDLKKAGVEATDIEAEQIRQTFITQNYEMDFGNEDYFLGIALQMSQELYPYVAVKDIHLIKSSDSNFFITSDDPVTIHRAINLNPMRASGFQDGIIVFPISPKFCLVLKNKGSPMPNGETPSDLVDQINEVTAFNTHMYVFSHTKSGSIEDLLNQSSEEDQGSVEVWFAGQRTIYKPPQKRQNKKPKK